ncbi:MAG: RNA methyltransferase [Candidatus Omnitrophica bacterium]|nr:RNA methyltransferase [Candidatus Omnitrophota bacterium]
MSPFKKTNIAVVLVEPENPDNIGSTARAMKNMGFLDLRLVRPPSNWKKKGRKLAMSAVDQLEKAQVYQTLEEAICDMTLVVGTTRRRRKKWQNFKDFHVAISGIVRKASKCRVAILFGKESKGLDNAALDLCDWGISIPTSSAYPSINLAQAVMIIVFSLSGGAWDQGEGGEDFLLPYVSKKEFHEALERFKSSLYALGYEREGNDTLERIVATFHGILKRSGLIHSEAQMIKGLSRRIQEKVSTL